MFHILLKYVTWRFSFQAFSLVVPMVMTSLRFGH
ncbi:hypothetical protein MPLSOD_100106 [Mesorhizobium sp. SOD10]|nr:hypothetical protein MPLSOD_100106 [Mesorhizobium sp. SOD10]